MEPHIIEYCNIVENNILKQNIKTILDIGSRDLTEGSYFAERYPNATIYSFECNPATLPLCEKKAKNYKNIILTSKAVNEYTGFCTFYPTDPEKTITTWEDGNPGASSLFKANGNYPIEHYVQKEITVPCIRLDDVLKDNNIEKIDMLWMDLQGAELLALKSLGSYLEKVSFICTEVEINPMYENQALFKDVDNFLNKKFTKIWGNTNVQWGTDVIYKNNELF
jgi:FkbM family methyltransferase